jgi:hypothetical protein
VTDRNEPPPVDDDIVRAQEQIARQVTALTRALQAAGYDFVCISLSKILRKDGWCACPGASGVWSSEDFTPALPREADCLRARAAEMDAVFEKSGKREAEHAMMEDWTDRMREDS